MTEAATQRHDCDTGRLATARRVAPSVALGVPLVLVNSAAIYGQAAWAHDHITNQAWTPATRWTLAVLFAVTVESVGIYLAIEAHFALMAGDASIRLRLGSYGVGALVGALNFSHFAGPLPWQVNAVAVSMCLLSSISPWLWAIRSRSINRDRLRALGQIDPRAVRFSPLRWVLYPRQTWRAFRAAVWAGVVVPADAVALVSQRVASKSRPPASTASAASPAQVAGQPTATRDTARDTKTAPAPTGKRGGGDNKQTRARQMCRDGATVTEILVALGLDRNQRRTVERWTKDLRQAKAGGGDNVDVAN